MSSAVIDRVRQPEYTGSNRCTPCTVINLILAIILAVGLAALSPPIAVGFFILATGAIVLRGYLVPGTPELTKRYLPERIYRWFGHDIPIHDGDDELLERTLMEWGVLEPCADEDDLCLDDAVREAFRDRVDSLDERGIDAATIAPVFDAEPDDIRLVREDPPVVRVGAGRSKWPSVAALLADVAMTDVLDTHVSEWHETSLEYRGPVLAGLRPFMDVCPGCRGEVALDNEVVESCCRRRDVVRLQCTSCESTLFEVDASAVQAAG